MSAFAAFKQNPFFWLVFLFAALLLVNGIAISDIGDFLIISGDPFKMSVPVERQFLYSSPLNFILAYLIGFNTELGYYFLHIFEIAVMLGCIGLAVMHKVDGNERQIRFITLLALTPLFLISVKWIGKTDPVLIGGFFLCWAFRTKWRILFTVLMVLAHREVGSLLTLALLFLEDKKDRNLIVGLVAANVFHLVYQYGILDQPPQTRVELMWDHAKMFLQAFSRLPALYIMSMFSWYWVVLLLNEPNRKEFAVIAVAFILSLLNEDFTRDFVLAGLPALLFHIDRVVKMPENNKFGKLFPLSVMHFQIAALGQIFMTGNVFIRWLGYFTYWVFK